MDLISEFYEGYRYFGYWSSPQRFGRQFPVKSRKEVVELIERYNGTYNCGISVCTILNEVPYLLYLPFDFDSDDLHKSWKDAKQLYNWIVDCGYDVSINFSGYRGFHVLITTVPKPYSKPQIRAAQKFFKRALNLPTCDKQIFGDIRRLIKIPGTIHAGKFKKNKDKIWKRVGEGSTAYKVKYTPGNPLDLDDLIEEEDIDFDFEFNDTSDYTKPKHPYPCIEKYINNEEPPQIIRYSYVSYYLKMGLTPDEIIDKLKEEHSEGKEHEWIDWSESTTTTQIYHIASGDYYPLKCETLKELGYCMKDCIYNTDGWEVKSVKDVNDD